MGVFFITMIILHKVIIYPCRWEEGPSMTSGRSSLSSLMSPPHLVCPETNPLAHSCPALGDNEQNCTLEPGTVVIITYLEAVTTFILISHIHVAFVHEVTFNPTQVTRFV